MINEERKQWFIRRSGRIVFRTKIPNGFPADDEIYQDGQIIRNKWHAEFLFEKEQRLHANGVMYFTSKDERDKHEFSIS